MPSGNKPLPEPKFTHHYLLDMQEFNFHQATSLYLDQCWFMVLYGITRLLLLNYVQICLKYSNRQKWVKINHYLIVIHDSEMHVSIKRTLSIWMCNPTLQSITLMLFINAHTMEELIQCRLWAILVYWETCMTNHANHVLLILALIFSTLRPRQNGLHFPDDNFKRIFLNQNVWIFYWDFTEVCS